MHFCIILLSEESALWQMTVWKKGPSRTPLLTPSPSLTHPGSKEQRAKKACWLPLLLDQSPPSKETGHIHKISVIRSVIRKDEAKEKRRRLAAGCSELIVEAEKQQGRRRDSPQRHGITETQLDRTPSSHKAAFFCSCTRRLLGASRHLISIKVVDSWQSCYYS